VQVDVFGAAARELDLLDIEPNRGPIHFADGTVLIQTIQSASQEPENQARHWKS